MYNVLKPGAFPKRPRHKSVSGKGWGGLAVGKIETPNNKTENENKFRGNGGGGVQTLTPGEKSNSSETHANHMANVDCANSNNVEHDNAYIFQAHPNTHSHTQYTWSNAWFKRFPIFCRVTVSKSSDVFYVHLALCFAVLQPIRILWAPEARFSPVAKTSVLVSVTRPWRVQRQMLKT